MTVTGNYNEIDTAIKAAAAQGINELKCNLYALCDEIGPRFAGTEGDRRAAEMIRATFERYGLKNVCCEPFSFVAWCRGGGARLRLVTPREYEVPAYAMPYGAATKGEGITARWVDVDSGSEDEVDKVASALRGAFALTDGSSGPRKGIQQRCVTAGAIGVLHGHNVDGMLFKTGSVHNGQESPIPAVNIPSETLALLRRMQTSGRLHLVVDSYCEPGTTCNVVGEIPGAEKPDELVIMGGHYDSHDISPGAYDNATGVSIVMEVARLLEPFRHQVKRTVRFVAFGAEEMGLLGSHDYARTHAKLLRKTRFMLNCDTPCLGRPHGLGFHKCSAAEAYVHTLAAEMGEEVRFGNRQHTSSDHYPFMRQGVITAGVGGKPGKSRGGGFYHMAGDTLDKIVVEEVSDTAAFIARALLRIANDDSWPTLQHDEDCVDTSKAG